MKQLLFVVLAALAAAPAVAQVEDEYARYELLAPDSASYRIVLDLTITREGTTHYTEHVRTGAAATAVSAIDPATGDPLKVEQGANGITVYFKRPVPAGAETRIRLVATYKDAGVYSRDGKSIVFSKTDLVPRNAIVLPAGYELVAANVPVQVIEETDGRLAASFMTPGEPRIVIKAQPLATRRTAVAPPPAAAPNPPSADAPPREQALNQIRVSERALQDREIVYFLKDPDTHAFSLYHDYTAAREGEHQYVNVVRAGSRVSDPSAKVLDTGEALKTRVLTGADVAREKIDIPDRVDPDTELIIPFTPVAKGRSARLRISETYTDPARYALVDGQLMWHRSFGRPRNDMVLPAGWYLTTSSMPAIVSQEPDGRIRLSYWNPRPDSLDVFVKARRR